MIKNYLKTGFRILFRNKTYSIINIIGFAVGLATALIFFLLIRHEISFEEHLSKKDQIYRIVSKKTTQKGTSYGKGVPYPLHKALRSELLNDDEVASLAFTSGANIEVDNHYYVENGAVFTDSVFCHFFDVKFITGKPAILNEPGNVILTQRLADKYFENSNPIGKK